MMKLTIAFFITLATTVPSFSKDYLTTSKSTKDNQSVDHVCLFPDRNWKPTENQVWKGQSGQDLDSMWCYEKGSISKVYGVDVGQELPFYLQLRSYKQQQTDSQNLKKHIKDIETSFSKLVKQITKQQDYNITELRATLTERINRWPATLIGNAAAYEQFKKQLAEDLNILLPAK